MKIFLHDSCSSQRRNFILMFLSVTPEHVILTYGTYGMQQNKISVFSNTEQSLLRRVCRASFFFFIYTREWEDDRESLFPSSSSRSFFLLELKSYSTRDNAEAAGRKEEITEYDRSWALPRTFVWFMMFFFLRTRLRSTGSHILFLSVERLDLSDTEYVTNMIKCRFQIKALGTKYQGSSDFIH